MQASGFSPEVIDIQEVKRTSVFHFLISFWQLIQATLGLDPGAFRTVQNSPSMGSVTRVVLILAAISETPGQCAVLFVNKVRPTRFVASVLLSSVIVTLSAFNWMFTSWFLATWIFGVPVPY